VFVCNVTCTGRESQGDEVATRGRRDSEGDGENKEGSGRRAPEESARGTAVWFYSFFSSELCFVILCCLFVCLFFARKTPGGIVLRMTWKV